METKRGNLTACVEKDEIRISNGRALVRLYLRDGGWVQEFHAADRKGIFHLLLSSIHKNLIPSSEHRACSSPMVSGDRPHLFAITRESLRMAFSNAEVIRHDEDGITAELTGSALGHDLRCHITLNSDASRAHIVLNDKIERSWSDPLIEYLMSSYAFLPDGRALAVGETPDYVWTPSLRPADNHVIGDSAFHSPVVVVQNGPFAAALIPDLDLLGKHRPMPTCLDLDINNGLLAAPMISYGFCGYEQVYEAQYFRHDVTHSRRLGANRLVLGFHLLLDADCKRNWAYRHAARFLWHEYGSRVPVPHHFRSSGEHVEPRRPIASLERPDTWAACGMHAVGRHNGDEALTRKARALKEAAVASPRNSGLFPTRFDTRLGRWNGCNADIGGAAYNLTECSTQLRWLLEWDDTIQKDPRILGLCRDYAAFLINARQRTGAIPAWYTSDGVPLSPSRSGNQTAASALFLAKLARVTGNGAHLRAAEKSAEFVLRELVPRRLYQDHNLIDTIDCTTLECPDPHTGARPQSGAAMLWAAQLCLELHMAGCGPGARSSTSRYIDRGLAILDELCLLQSVWTKPWASSHIAHGLCARGNLGAKYDPELTAEFARCAIGYGALAGDREYCERGAAALRAVLQEPALTALTRARIAASAAAIDRDHGAIYVHVSGKWAVALNGWQVEDFEVSKGEVSIRVDGGTEDHSRIVFGGMRGKSYNVHVNDRVVNHSREELASGIPLSIERRGAQPESQFTLVPY